MERFEIRNILGASVLPIIISIVLVIIWVGLEVASFLIDSGLHDTLQLISNIYMYAMFPIYLVIYLWAGARAVRRYRQDAIGAGIVSAFSYIVSGIFHLIITSIIGLMVVKQFVDIPGFHSTESTLAASLVGDVAGTSGVGISFLCGAGIIIMGALANFVVGSFGGLFATGRSAAGRSR